MKIFRILSPGKPKQLALPGSSKKFYKGLKMSFSKFQKYCILPFLTYSNQIPNLLTFTFSCIRIFPTIYIVTVCVSYLVVSDSATPWLPGSFVHGILQARILEWLPFLSLGQGLNPGLLHCGQILDHLSHEGGPPFSLPLPKTMLSSLGH